MASPSIGLYVGTENADLVALSGSFQHPRLISFGRVQFPAQGTWRSLVRAEEGESPAGGTGTGTASTPAVTEEELARLIQSLLQKVRLPSAKVFTAVASEAVIIRYFQMPTIPVHERKMAIAFEAKKYLPFKLEDLVTDYEVITHRSDPALMRIMFFGIKKSSSAAYLSLLKSVGLTPLCLEAAPICLMRLTRQTGQLAPGQVATLLSVERDTATISIARNDLLYLSRNVTVLPSSESLEGPSPELLEALTNETRVSIDYYRRRFLGEPPVNKVILFGRAVEPKRLAELKTSLDLPVEWADPYKRMAGVKEIPLSLAVATGLALRGLENRAGETNLLPPERRRELQGLLKPLVFQVVAAAIALIFLKGLSISSLTSLEQKISALSQQQAYPAGMDRGWNLNQLQQYRNERQKELRLVQKLSRTQGKRTALLSEATRLLPNEAWLKYLLLEETLKQERQEAPGNSAGQGIPSLADPGLVLKLVGGSYTDNRDKELEGINSFLASLKSNPLFGSIFSEFHLDSVQRGRFYDEEVTEFRLTCASNARDLKGGPRRSSEWQAEP